MEEKTSALHPNKLGLQEYLSLGYIYLILLGLVGDVVYYKFLGINILSYSTISDVLMAPINTLVYDFRVLVLVTLTIALGYFFYTRLAPAFHFKIREKDWYKKSVLDMEQTDRHFLEARAGKRPDVLLIFLPLLFVGLKIGSGSSTRERIAKGDTKASHTVVFNDNTSKNIKIIGQNSSYIFYLLEAQKDILITPISGNVKEIRILQ